ncbi:MAG: alpha-L-fucosidase [Prevotella sp.]
MKKFFIIFAIVCLHIEFVNAQRSLQLSLDPSKAEWFREAKFGMFIHWGLYSILEGTYNGHTMPDKSFKNGDNWYAEWIQTRLEIPAKEYQAIKDRFNPTGYNAEQWVLDAKNAGIRYIVITAKHHDGFALWDSKVSDYDIMSTPYKKDLLQQLVDACKKHGMKYGFYYSHWQDWEDPNGALPNWQYVRPDKEFEKYWQKKALPQVKELLVKYDPDLLWFDTWDEDCHITAQRRDELIRLIRKHSDKCLINGRICYNDPGENIDFLEMHDNSYPNSIMNRPWQAPATMQESWGYHAKDFNWKSADKMLGYLVYSTSRGGNYLLNVGPKADGTFPIQAQRRLREMGAWMLANGEAVYGAKPIRIDTPEGVYLSQKTLNGKHYLYISLTKPMRQLTLCVNGKGQCQVLETGRPVSYTNHGDAVCIDIPHDLFNDSSIQVLKLEIR